MRYARGACAALLLLLHGAPQRSSSLMFCSEVGCRRHASYGMQESRSRTACAQHKAAHHVYLIGQLCEFGNGTTSPCRNRGTYGLGTSRCCREHRSSGMLLLQSRKCRDKDCTKQPIFGASNSTRPLYCRQHKSEAHIDVVNRRCQLCSRQGVFGDPGTSASTRDCRRTAQTALIVYCQQHRKEGHVNLLSKKCRADGCNKQPYFGDPVSREPLWCNMHKAHGHEDVKNRRCCHPHGCTRHPAYGDLLVGVASYCKQHKAPTHVSLLKSRCCMYHTNLTRNVQYIHV